MVIVIISVYAQIKTGLEPVLIELANIQLRIFEPQHAISNNVVCVASKGSDQPVHTQSDQSLC